ncbi:MAG: EcsC family protein, partial [bacterium]
MKEEISETELASLKEAKGKLEHPSILVELSNIAGKPIEKVYSLLPVKFQEGIGKITKSVLLRSLNMLVSNTYKRNNPKPKNLFHKVLVTGTGAAGGFFGLSALALELPVTTAIMLRSIMDIARSKGFDINDMNTKLACLEVFALGGNAKTDDYSDSAYYLIRGALAKEVADASKYILKKGIINESAPAIVSYISKIASRFGVMVSEEVAAKSIPIIGSVSGGTINYIFMNHFQKMADGHFTVKNLEDKYG